MNQERQSVWEVDELLGRWQFTKSSHNSYRIQRWHPPFPPVSTQSYSQMWKNKPFWTNSSASCFHQSHDARQIIFDCITYSSTLNKVCRVLSQPCLYYLEAELVRRGKEKQTNKQKKWQQQPPQFL